MATMPRTHVEGADAPPLAPSDNLLSTLQARAAADPARLALRHPDGDGWRDVTWGQLSDRVRRVAAGLVALGVAPGDRVVLMSATSVDWTVADLAVLSAGGVTVPVYETSSVAQCEWILSDSGARVAIAGKADHAKQLDAARGAARGLGDVFVVNDGGLDAIAERGADGDREQVERGVAALGPADLASLVYTSGTTGNPKGCMLTHGNLLATARGSARNLAAVLDPPDASTLLFLPLAHVFARIIQTTVLEAGVVLGYARSTETLAEDLRSFAPTFLLAVPRVLEKVFTTAQRGATGARRRVFDLAVTAAQDAAAGRTGLVPAARRALADRLVYARLRAALGGRLRHAISGGAPLAPHLAAFFTAAGITVLEGYGLTETSAGTTCNTPSALRLGTVGRPTPGVGVRLAGDGEVHVRGPGVFRGYWHDQEATRAALDDDGWFATGDLGTLDDEGFLTISGRKKEILVTASGKNVSPTVLEGRLEAHRLVSQAMVVGDARPFVAVLVTLEPDELSAFAREQGLAADELAAGAHALRAELERAIAHANAAVSRAESIRAFTVLDRQFSLEQGELTPSLKLRRAVIAEHFADEIERLYAAPQPPGA